MKQHHGVFLIILSAWLLGSCTSILPSFPSDSATSNIGSSELPLSSNESLTSSLDQPISSSSEMVSELLSSTISSSESIASSSLSSSSSASSLPSSSALSSSQNLITIASNAPNYYQSISPSATGDALKNALDILISSNINVAYDWWRYESADESLTETNKVLTIYPRRNYLKTAHVSGNTAATWNREHSYPQSKISGGALDDNHHIFADDWKTNSTRGNYRFGIVTTKNSSTQVKDSSNLLTDNYLAGGFFEPNDAAKGEVARATLYLNTLYGFAIDGNFQTTELAILWALQYPPTNRDMQRNNRVYSNQGNRNPYIDQSDYICKVYGLTSLNTRLACGLA